MLRLRAVNAAVAVAALGVGFGAAATPGYAPLTSVESFRPGDLAPERLRELSSSDV